MIVQQILDNAIYKSVQDRAFEKIILPHYRLVALNEFNNVLDLWRDLIPYASRVTFNNVDNLLATLFVEVDSVSYVINKTTSVLFSRNIRQFREQKNVLDLHGYPEIYYFDQLNQNIDVYPLPSNPDYQFIVDGRIAVANLGEFDTVPANMPTFMQDALTYEIAFRLAAEYGVSWDGKKETLRTMLYQQLMNKKNVDLTAKSDCVLGMPDADQSAPFPLWYYMSGGSQ
jgi:hypothetical protein